MPGTPRLILAQAAQAYRKGQQYVEPLSELLSPAQVGAAYKLQQLAAIELVGAAEDSVQQLMQLGLSQLIAAPCNDRLSALTLDLRDLERTLGEWLQFPDDALSQARIGYWLMSIFVRGLGRRETAQLTSFLVGDSRGCPVTRTLRSVRRYPTGGVSEKQALILPAFLRCLAQELKCCSSFLVARRLAHTGGTQDKLAVLPGARLVAHDKLQSWDGEHPPVQYFSAGPDFCPRDAMLYRMRSDTGTVNELGLMAASIMAKQIAFPANVIILDVLFGGVAFLQSRAEAEQFMSLCDEVGRGYGIQVHPHFRESITTAARYIGNVLEVYETADSLYRAIGLKSTYETLDYEIKLAIDFMRLFGKHLGVSSEQVEIACINSLRKGLVFDSLVDLWAEHGVEAAFLEQVRRNPEEALLRELSTATVCASRPGVVSGWDVIAIADLVNHRLNAYRYAPTGEIEAVTKGGVKISVCPGEIVSQGQTLATLYSEGPLASELVPTVRELFILKPIC